MDSSNKKKTIFIISNEPWGEIWYSKQHYANELAKLGHEVFFINPSPSWKPTHLLSIPIQREEINTHLTVISYLNPLPLRIFTKFFQQVNDWFLCVKLSKLSSNREVLIWQFDPTRLIYLFFFSKKRRIYHLVDPMDKFWGDLIIAKHSELIIIIRNDFYPRYNGVNPRIIHIPHGVSEDEFNMKNKELLESIKSQYDNYILFIGTINQDVDLDLLHAIAQKFPEWPLLLIGPNFQQENSRGESNFFSLLEFGNVHYIERVEAQLLKYFISRAKVCLVPYKSKSKKFKRTPLKIINYLTQFKPIVSTVKVPNLDEKAVFLAEDHAHFLRLTELALNNQIKTDMEQIRQYLDQIKYPIHIRKILKSLDK